MEDVGKIFPNTFEIIACNHSVSCHPNHTACLNRVSL